MKAVTKARLVFTRRGKLIADENLESVVPHPPNHNHHKSKTQLAITTPQDATSLPSSTSARMSSVIWRRWASTWASVAVFAFASAELIAGGRRPFGVCRMTVFSHPIVSWRGHERTERSIPRPRTGLQDHAVDRTTGVLASAVVGRHHLGNPGSDHRNISE